MRSITFILFLVPFLMNSQVGIGTTAPKAQLDIVATDKLNPAEIDGILIPRVEKFPSANPGSEQNGMLVFLSKDQPNFTSGFYYWSALDSSWKAMAANSAASNFYKPGTSLSPNNVTDAAYREGNIGIGTDQISSRLQIAIPAGKDLSLKKTLEVDNANSATDNLTTYGIVNDNRSATNGTKYGIKSNVGGAGTGIHYGIFNETYQNTGTNDIYGIFNRVGRTFGARSNNFGIYNEIGSVQGVGNIYGIYSVAYGDSNSNVFAGYFAGRLGIGITPDVEYVFPDSRGLENQVLVTDRVGKVSWKHPGAVNYISTEAVTGDYPIGDEVGTLRINNQVTGLIIPKAADNKGRIIILVGWPATGTKNLIFQGSDNLLEITTNTQVTTIKGGQTYQIQSAGNRWILLFKS
ncbi:hypothetical protein RM553_18905 [Zunongwangia sp. F363]|uniref:Uncharacterized protein n=1 Tax=Autumnicola tepida TaxID=3075595 RepID=A0ABU3CEY9_9FLAO|nr:hypothetical protein [Zunongwangia sp. F363]MDT0644915.1 hypothetical protein [Zunongwangia sp. F363]